MRGSKLQQSGPSMETSGGSSKRDERVFRLGDVAMRTHVQSLCNPLPSFAPTEDTSLCDKTVDFGHFVLAEIGFAAPGHSGSDQGVLLLEPLDAAFGGGAAFKLRIVRRWVSASSSTKRAAAEARMPRPTHHEGDLFPVEPLGVLDEPSRILFGDSLRHISSAFREPRVSMTIGV